VTFATKRNKKPRNREVVSVSISNLKRALDILKTQDTAKYNAAIVKIGNVSLDGNAPNRNRKGEHYAKFYINVEACTKLIKVVWTEEDVTEIAADPVNDDFERGPCEINPAGTSGKFIRLVVE
jgi:hypothetical protein